MIDIALHKKQLYKTSYHGKCPGNLQDSINIRDGDSWPLISEAPINPQKNGNHLASSIYTNSMRNPSTPKIEDLDMDENKTDGEPYHLHPAHDTLATQNNV